MNYHPTDTFMQSIFPVLPVPKLGEFQELNREGHRYLAADDGLWLEVRTPWLYFRQKIGDSFGVPIPYGKISSEIRFTCPPIPKHLLADFVQAYPRGQPERDSSPDHLEPLNQCIQASGPGLHLEWARPYRLFDPGV